MGDLPLLAADLGREPPALSVNRLDRGKLQAVHLIDRLLIVPINVLRFTIFTHNYCRTVTLVTN
jgi:hypothetical protein